MEAEKEVLKQHVHYLRLELQSVTSELERTKLEAQTWREVVEARSDCLWTPHTTEKLSSCLQDYANHPEYGDAFRRANLGILLELEKVKRDKVSVCALLHAHADVNYEQLCSISRATVPPDPRTFLYLFQRHMTDIASKRPMFQASMMSFPVGTAQHVIDQALSAYILATQIAYKGEPWQKNPTRFQFKIKEKDKAFVLLGSLDRSLSVNTLKRQVGYVTSSGILTALPTISEDADDDEGGILDDDETFARFDDGSAHAGGSMCANRHLDQDGGCDVSSIGERFVSDGGSMFGEAESVMDSGLPLDLIVADNGEDDDVSTIGARESFIPTDIERRRYIIAARVDDEVAELDPSDRIVAKRVILEASASLPPDKKSQLTHIGESLVKALPGLSPSLLHDKAANLVVSK